MSRIFMLKPADGADGVKNAIIQAVKDAGPNACPPMVVGVGIGGTADLCMRLAKEAAVLRKIGSRHPEPEVARLEEALLKASRGLGLGPMGSEGINAVMALHIEKALTHTAALPVAVNAQCLVGRRWRALISAGNAISFPEE